MLISKEEKFTFFGKNVKDLFPCYFSNKKEDEKLMSQADFTKNCDELTCQMALIFNFQDNLTESYDELLKILNELLEMNSDAIVFPYNTFNSNSIPRILTVLIKEFPSSDIYLKSFELSEILSRNSSGARQFCNNDFIPLILQYLSSSFQNVSTENKSIILMLLRILSNIFCNTDEGMMKYCPPVLELLLNSISEIKNEDIIDPILMVISNLLNYSQYFDTENALKIANFFIELLDPKIQEPHLRIPFILHQIIDISIEVVPIVVNPTTIPILIELTSSSFQNVRISTILIFISFLRKSEVEYKEIIYDALSWSWFGSVWINSQQETQEFLMELFYYLILYKEELLQAAINDQIISAIIGSYESASFSLRIAIIRNIIRVVLIGDIDFLILLIDKFNFLNVTDEFLSTYSTEIYPFIIPFYNFVLKLIEKGQAQFDSLDLNNLNIQLSDINTSNLDLELTRNIKMMTNCIESLLDQMQTH